MRTLKYEESTEFICELMQCAAHGEEVEVSCPQCGRPLVLAVTRERASALGVHPGIFCPTSRNHVYRLLSLMEPGGPAGGSWVDKLLGK
jgi:hypothetical protein